MLEQKGVLQDVLVGKVKLNLVYDFIDEFVRRRLNWTFTGIWPGVDVAVRACLSCVGVCVLCVGACECDRVCVILCERE